MTHTLTDLVDLARLRRYLDGFTEATGVSTLITDAEGHRIAGSRQHRICEDFHRKNELTLPKCLESGALPASALPPGEEPVLYRCLNGLSHAVSPIVIEGRHIASILCGQFLQAPPDVVFFRAQAARYGFDERQYLDALSQVPVITDPGRHLAAEVGGFPPEPRRIPG